MIDLFITRDLCIPLMKHPHQAAPLGTRYDRVIGEPRNPGIARLVCRLMGRPVSRAAFFELLCGPTTIATGRFNLSH
jgi:hypothetical protein